MSDIREFKIYTYGAQILREECKYVEPGSDEAVSIGEELLAVCRTLGAAGMAANQLGYDKSICCVRLNDGDYITMVNPRITGKLLDSVRRTEYCYSIPGYSAMVMRGEAGVDVDFQNDDITEIKKATFMGSEARYLQHECDHLNGIMISDKNKMFGREKLKQIYRKCRTKGFSYTIDELGERVT